MKTKYEVSHEHAELMLVGHEEHAKWFAKIHDNSKNFFFIKALRQWADSLPTILADIGNKEQAIADEYYNSKGCHTDEQRKAQFETDVAEKKKNKNKPIDPKYQVGNECYPVTSE
jgi:hypothetical protein